MSNLSRYTGNYPTRTLAFFSPLPCFTSPSISNGSPGELSLDGLQVRVHTRSLPNSSFLALKAVINLRAVLLRKASRRSWSRRSRSSYEILQSRSDNHYV